MRRGLYFVLMVVLVLRGLTGTAMAAGVLPPAMAQVHTAADQPAAMAPTSHDDLHAVHAAAITNDATAATDAHTHHPETEEPQQTSCDPASSDCAAHNHHATTCSACEICHSAMLDAPAPQALVLSATGSLPPSLAYRFDSAVAALTIKPPIA